MIFVVGAIWTIYSMKNDINPSLPIILMIIGPLVVSFVGFYLDCSLSENTNVFGITANANESRIKFAADSFLNQSPTRVKTHYCPPGSNGSITVTDKATGDRLLIQYHYDEIYTEDYISASFFSLDKVILVRPKGLLPSDYKADADYIVDDPSDSGIHITDTCVTLTPYM